jgi:hypothetical protein
MKPARFATHTSLQQMLAQLVRAADAAPLPSASRLLDRRTLPGMTKKSLLERRAQVLKGADPVVAHLCRLRMRPHVVVRHCLDEAHQPFAVVVRQL